MDVDIINELFTKEVLSHIMTQSDDVKSELAHLLSNENFYYFLSKLVEWKDLRITAFEEKLEKFLETEGHFHYPATLSKEEMAEKEKATLKTIKEKI